MDLGAAGGGLQIQYRFGGMLPQERQEEMRMLHEEAMLKMELFGRHAGSADWPSTLVVDFAKKFEQRKPALNLLCGSFFFAGENTH